MTKTNNKANEILATRINMIPTDIIGDFFKAFTRHYHLTQSETCKALDNLNALRNTDITLNLALLTACGISR